MKLLIVSQSDKHGGAARASWRLHRALVKAGVDSRILARRKESDDVRVTGPQGLVAKFLVPLRFHLGKYLIALQKTANKNFHSGNFLPSRLAPVINASDADVVHLHFTAGETLSVADQGRITKPLVWTLHDMWAFSGTEHYGDEGPTARWREGYYRNNRPPSDRGPDWDRSTWERKRRAWTGPFTLVTPSHWLARCAEESALFRGRKVTVIPNALDTDVFQPLDQAFCRKAFGFPLDAAIVLFGALDGAVDVRKGYDLLIEALTHWGKGDHRRPVLGVVFGQSEPVNPPQLPFPLRWVGHLEDDVALTLLYNAADVTLVPSRQEAFGQTASESQACGTPVVAFRATGLVDVVADRVTGYLAEPYDSRDLAAGVAWALDRTDELGRAARERAVRLWSLEVVAQQHRELYDAVLAGERT